MPSPKELAKALARQDSVTQQPRNRFLGAIADAAGYVSDQADRYVVPERDPLFGGMRGGDLLPLRNVNRLLDDLSYGGRITTGRGQTTTLRPEVVDTVALGGMLKNPVKLGGIAALKNAAKQIQNKTGFAKFMPDTRMGIVPEGQAMSAPAKKAMNDGSQDVITYIGRKGQKFQITKQRDNELLDIHSSIADKAREIFGDGVESFDSGMSSSRYVKLPNGAKIRVSDHPLPSDFAAMHGVPDVEVRGGQDLQKAIDYMIDAKSNKTMPNSQKRYDDLSLRDELRSKGVPLFAVDARQIRKLVNSSVGYDDIANQLQQKYPKLTDSDAAKIYTVIGRGKFDKFDSSKTPLRLAHEVAQRNAAYGDNVGGAMMQRPKTEFEILHDTAQRNAALPKEQGGLGLPEGNTGMDRAGAMGAVDYLHGTQRLDRLLSGKNLDPKRATSGPMPFGTDTPPVASGYAMNKQDTSRMASNTGDLAESFQVSPKSLGLRGKNPYTVEQSWNLLSPEVKADILDKSRRIGYENPAQGEGAWTLHPTSQGAPFSPSHFDYELKAAKGNPLAALRSAYGESGMLDAYAPSELADIYKLAGYPHEISQANAPWTSAQGVLTGKAMINNPLKTSNVEEIRSTVIPALKEAFAKDKTRLKTSGSDQWAKDARYTPKDWVNQLEQDLAKGDNSYVWTSIPDKVTDQIKKLGYQGIIDTGGKGGDLYGHQVVIPFQPSQVRSRFAAFDPFRRHEADILAGVGVGGMLDPQAIAEALRQQDRK